MRDSQRAKLYKADDIVFHYKGNGVPYETDILSIQDCQAFANKVTRSPIWKAMKGKPFIHVKPVRQRLYARSWLATIEIPPWAHYRAMVLHELSHSIVEKTWRDAVHGPRYVFVYRRLIEQEFGIESRQTFDRVAEQHGVRWSGTTVVARFPGIV